MLILTICVLLITILILVYKNQFLSPLFVFSSVWLLVIGLFSLRLFGIYDIAFNTKLVLFCGICCYILGYSSQNRGHLVTSNNSKPNNTVAVKKISILSLILVVVAFPFYSPLLLQVLVTGTLGAGKTALISGQISSGGVILQYVVRPFTYIIIALSAYFLLTDRRKKTIIICGLCFCIFEFFGAGAKVILVYYVLCLFVAFGFNKTGFIFHQKLLTAKKIMLAISGVILVALIQIVGWKNIYFYGCGCIPILDNIVNGSFYISEGYTYGFLSFNSVIRLIIKGLGIFGIEVESELFERANMYFERFEYTVEVANGVDYNAFHSLFGDFYCDFGYLGVCILSFLFGAFSCWCYKQHVSKNSLWSHTLYCILMYYTLFSMVRFHMSNTFLGLMLIYTVVILKRIIHKKSKVRAIDIALD